MTDPDAEGAAADRAKAIHNERAKITATYLNGLAIALVVVGTLSPAITARPSAPVEVALQVVIGLVCLAGSGLLHSQARRHLGNIR